MFRKNIHSFRGISIIFVVFSHCYYAGICVFGHNENFYAQIMRNMISGASAFFVFISGFLLLEIYHTNKDYKKMIVKKFKYIYLPFLIFTSVDLVYLIFRVISDLILNNWDLIFYLGRIKKIDFVSTFVVGKSLYTFGVLWYIPFIMLIYMLSPIFLYYRNSKYQIGILFLSLLTSFVIFRNSTSNFISLIHNLIYFLPFYFLGIIFHEHEEKISSKISSFHLFTMFLMSCAIGLINQLLPSFVVKKFDVMMVQKILFCFIFFLLFKRIKSELLVLNTLAKYSFGIYFIHPLFILFLFKIVSLLKITYQTESFLAYLITASFVLFSSLGLAIIVKNILGPKSKYFIGV